MNEYLIRFKMNGEWKRWIRQGTGIYGVLDQAKEDIIEAYGKLGSICIDILIPC